MSKSYGNAIYLSDDAKSVGAKVDAMLTDPQRSHRHIPGNPEICPVFASHKVFSGPDTVSWSEQGCRTAGIGCRDCKGRLREGLLAILAPIAERRANLSADPARVDKVLEEGALRAKDVAGETLRLVRSGMGLSR